VDVGVLILPEHRWAEAEPLWRKAEDLGFAHVWTYDHLAWRTLADQPWHAAVPALAAAALATSRIRLGTLVATPNFRHPVTFARELVTLDDLSDGRLTVGVGAGGPGFDASMLGQQQWSGRERAERFAEFVALLDRLLREPNTSHDGRYFRAVEARTHPGCVQRPRAPLAVAASGPRGMRVVANHAEMWVTNGDRDYVGPPLGPEEGAAMFRRQSRLLDEVCRGAGRDPSTLRRLVLTGPRLDGGLASPAAFQEVVAAYAEAGATDLVVHWPRTDEPYAGDAAVLDRLALG
jgi:alkanesulfonate monooxygenase SsuD/methylene tetrahydromethanopterin reductase-like flavin-dependent oxidoreductase (luciferase family)